MFPSSLLNTDAVCFSPEMHYHHLHLLQESLFQHPNPVVQDAADDIVPLGCTNTPLLDRSKLVMNMMNESAPKKKKPDNRSKIRTAKGLRDRRVRMSIGTARKFFDLQDLLGFDKPSSTLEWLLTNSKKAILELSAASSSSDQETVVVKRQEDGSNSMPTTSQRTAMYSIKQAEQQFCNDDLKTTMKQKVTLLARESRNKARARARDRTKEKCSAANMNHQKNEVLNNPKDVVSSDHHQTYLNANGHKFSSMSMMKSVSQEDQERISEEDLQNRLIQQLQLHSYDSTIKNYYRTGLNPILSPNHWETNCVYPQQDSFAADQLISERGVLNTSDFNINGRISWDNFHSNYRTL